MVLWKQIRDPQDNVGAFRGIDFDAGPDDDPQAAARRAAYTALISFAPNTYVIGIDREHDNMLVHELDPRPAGRDPRAGAGQAVTGWLLVAIVLLLGLVPCGIVCMRDNADGAPRRTARWPRPSTRWCCWYWPRPTTRRSSSTSPSCSPCSRSPAPSTFARFMERWL